MHVSQTKTVELASGGGASSCRANDLSRLFHLSPSLEARVPPRARRQWRCRDYECPARGAEWYTTVAATSSSQQKISSAQELGTSGGVLYTRDNWWWHAKRIPPSGRGFNVVLDTMGNWQESVHALRPGGRVVVLDASQHEEAVLDVWHFYFRPYDLLGRTLHGPRDFTGLLLLIETGYGRPTSRRPRHSLNQGAETSEYLEDGTGFGEVVLDHAGARRGGRAIRWSRATTAAPDAHLPANSQRGQARANSTPKRQAEAR